MIKITNADLTELAKHFSRSSNSSLEDTPQHISTQSALWDYYNKKHPDTFSNWMLKVKEMGNNYCLNYEREILKLIEQYRAEYNPD